MQRNEIFLGLLMVVTLQGCSKDSNSAAVQINGACTQATISAYNRLVGRSVSTYSTRSDLVSIKSDCSSYKSLIGGSSCVAEKQSTGERTTISASSVDGVCNQASQMLNALDNQNQQTGAGSDTTTNYGICSSAVVASYNETSSSLLFLSELSSIESLENANQKCYKFDTLMSGKKTCKASKNGVDTWVSYNDFSTSCAKAKNLKLAAQKQAETDKKIVIGTSVSNERIYFTLIRSVSATASKDTVFVFQAGRAFIPNEINKVNESQPYCLVSEKFSNFTTGVGRVAFKKVFVPENENLLALANTNEKFNEENTINCLNAQGLTAASLTIGDLRAIFKGFVVIELVN